MLSWLARFVTSGDARQLKDQDFVPILANLLQVLSRSVVSAVEFPPEMLRSALHYSLRALHNLIESHRNLKPSVFVSNFVRTIQAILQQSRDWIEVIQTAFESLQLLASKDINADDLALLLQITLDFFDHPELLMGPLDLMLELSRYNNEPCLRVLNEAQLADRLLPLIQIENEKAVSICYSLCSSDTSLMNNILTEPVIIALIDLLKSRSFFGKKTNILVLLTKFCTSSTEANRVVLANGLLQACIFVLENRSAGQLASIAAYWTMFGRLNEMTATELAQAIRTPKCLHHVLHALLHPLHASTVGKVRTLLTKLFELGETFSSILYPSLETFEPCNPYIDYAYAFMQREHEIGTEEIGLGRIDMNG